jgi:hypothetical protein
LEAQSDKQQEHEGLMGRVEMAERATTGRLLGGGCVRGPSRDRSCTAGR